jgi:hypothetical protein
MEALMILHIKADGSGEDALAQAIAQHRAAFFAGVTFQDTEPVAPAPAECCSELGADQDDVKRPMQMLGGLLAVAVLAVALIGAAAALWPSEAPKPAKPAAAFPAGWA